METMMKHRTVMVEIDHIPYRKIDRRDYEAARNRFYRRCQEAGVIADIVDVTFVRVKEDHWDEFKVEYSSLLDLEEAEARSRRLSDGEMLDKGYRIGRIGWQPSEVFEELEFVCHAQTEIVAVTTMRIYSPQKAGAILAAIASAETLITDGIDKDEMMISSPQEEYNMWCVEIMFPNKNPR